MRKNRISAAVISLLIAASTAVPVYAENENSEEKTDAVSAADTSATGAEESKVYSKSCGETAEWSYDTESKTLTISGTGRTDTYFESENWFKEVKHLIVEEGILEISSFYGCSTLETISLPEGITRIDGAFRYCTALKSVALPDSIRGITYGTFMGCSSLEEVHLGSDFIVLGWGEFAECTSLKHIDLPETLTSIDSEAFNNSGLKSIKLPDELKKLSIGTFGFCKDLEEVTLPAKLEHIESEAFYGCTSLEKIDIPENTSQIDANAFMSSSSLKEVIIRCDKCIIDNTAFYLCDPSMVIKAHKGSTAEEYAEKNGYAFEVLDENSETTASPETRNPGDVDLNGKIDITDISVLSLALVDHEELSENSFRNADVNGDGNVKLDDLATIRQYLSKKIPSLDVDK